jgi:hypothetical protein
MAEMETYTYFDYDGALLRVGLDGDGGIATSPHVFQGPHGRWVRYPKPAWSIGSPISEEQAREQQAALFTGEGDPPPLDADAEELSPEEAQRMGFTEVPEAEDSEEPEAETDPPYGPETEQQ